MSWRLASRLSVVTLALLVVLIVAVLQARNSFGGASSNANPSASSSSLQGTDLGGTPAPDFRLTDQFGHSVSLSQFRGKPVVLTFLYTHCPDVCPLTAEKLHTVMQSLGADAQKVGVLAVSVDPKGDTLTAAQQFSQTHKMLNYWHFLIGTHAELAPVWSAYSIYSQPAAVNTPASTGSVSHSTALYVIDKQGRERVFLSDDFTPQQLSGDLRVLLGE